MAEVSFSIQMDENLKEQFEQICSDLGISASMAITIFARTVACERKIPFEIAAPIASTTREDGLNAFLALREEAHRNGLQDMTLDDVNTEIQQMRAESKVPQSRSGSICFANLHPFPLTVLPLPLLLPMFDTRTEITTN